MDKFKECYEKLYNSAPTSDAMIVIKENMTNLISDNIHASEVEINKITPEVVKFAAIKMKPGKADVSESYSSDVFINGPDSLFEHLALVFRSFLVHGTISKEILACAFLPLFKGGLKNPAKFASYRAIAGSSQLLKLFE